MRYSTGAPASSASATWRIPSTTNRPVSARVLRCLSERASLILGLERLVMGGIGSGDGVVLDVRQDEAVERRELNIQGGRGAGHHADTADFNGGMRGVTHGHRVRAGKEGVGVDAAGVR